MHFWQGALFLSERYTTIATKLLQCAPRDKFPLLYFDYSFLWILYLVPILLLSTEELYVVTPTLQINFQKWSIPALFLIYFCLFTQTLQFLQQIYVKNVHPVYCAGIGTHNLQA